MPPNRLLHGTAFFVGAVMALSRFSLAGLNNKSGLVCKWGENMATQLMSAREFLYRKKLTSDNSLWERSVAWQSEMKREGSGKGGNDSRQSTCDSCPSWGVNCWRFQLFRYAACIRGFIPVSFSHSKRKNLLIAHRSTVKDEKRIQYGGQIRVEKVLLCFPWKLCSCYFWKRDGNNAR